MYQNRLGLVEPGTAGARHANKPAGSTCLPSCHRNHLILRQSNSGDDLRQQSQSLYQQVLYQHAKESGACVCRVASNSILYKPGEHPDHVVVIKYVPNVGDSKRAMDEYMSEIFMGGRNTIAMHNTCEDSLLAAPIILDLVLLAELTSRIQVCFTSCCT